MSGFCGDYGGQTDGGEGGEAECEAVGGEGGGRGRRARQPQLRIRRTTRARSSQSILPNGPKTIEKIALRLRARAQWRARGGGTEVRRWTC